MDKNIEGAPSEVRILRCHHKRCCNGNAFSLTTAMQILSVERRHLTNPSRYGIITTEKEFMRSRIFDFLTVFWSHPNGLDHSFDHLQSWTTWKQCEREHPKASFLDSKDPKSLVSQGKNRCRFLWEQDAAGSNPVTPTISSVHNESDEHSIFFFCLYFFIWSRFSALFSFVMPWWADSSPQRLVCSQGWPYAFCAIRESADNQQSGNG